MKIYRICKKDKEHLTPEEREEIKNRFKDIQCSFAKDKDGYYCYTHRARSESYPSISQIPLDKVDFINSTSSDHKAIKVANFESVEDVMYLIDDERENIIREYYSKGRKKGSMMSWSVIPFAPLKKIWEDRMKYGVVHNEQAVNDIANQLLKNLARLQAATDLSGHSQFDPEDLVKEMGLKPVKGNNTDFYFSFLETPYGSPISDYGLKPLWNLAEQLVNASTAEEKLLVIDQMLQVTHRRGDLAALFIEGGEASLTQLYESPTDLSLPSEENKKEVEASGVNWYKTTGRSGIGPVGTPMSVVGTEPVDNATRFGSLQEKIFEMLNHEEKISTGDKEWLLRIYNSYQGGRKMSRRMALIVLDIWKRFINASSEQTTSNHEGWYKTAVSDGEFRDWKNKVDKIKDDIRDLKKDDKDIEKRVKDLEKILSDLNIGFRRFWQDKTQFNSLQRKLERLESVEQEWKKYKEEISDTIKQEVEKRTKARATTFVPSK